MLGDMQLSKNATLSPHLNLSAMTLKFQVCRRLSSSLKVLIVCNFVDITSNLEKLQHDTSLYFFNKCG